MGRQHAVNAPANAMANLPMARGEPTSQRQIGQDEYFADALCASVFIHESNIAEAALFSATTNEDER